MRSPALFALCAVLALAGALVAVWRSPAPDAERSGVGGHAAPVGTPRSAALREPLAPHLRALVSEAQLAGDRGDHLRAVELAERVLAVVPDEPVALAIRGSCLIGAEGDLDRAIALAPLPWMLRNRATLRSRRRDWPGVLADLERFLRDEPPTALVLAQRGEARLKHGGDLAGALEDAAAAIRLDARSAPAWRLLAHARRTQGEREGAFAAMRKAVSIDAEYLPAAEELGAMCVEAGDADEALRLLDAVVARDPDRALARGARGTALMFKGRQPEAVEDLARAAALQPEDPSWAANLASAHLRAAAWSEACAAAERALAVAPDHVIALRARGLGREALGDLDGARADLERVAALDPRRTESDMALREALARLRAR